MKLYASLLLVLIFSQIDRSFGQASDNLSSQELKKLSLEELMNVEVISVSRHLEKLTEVSSAIQVITQKDIRNAGVKTVAEALRLAPNLQVAQVNSSQWAISARGFNNVLANKLLVLVDGRTVYTPLYAGVFWDVQNLVLEDIDRIEVISGPGGTLWGANAVNGIINIITKNAKDTKGLFVEAASGSGLPGLGSIRYGGRISDKLFYRVYGTGFKLGNTIDSNGLKANDEWPMVQGGARLDWEPSANNKISFQQGIYYGKPNPDGGDTSVKARGDNISVRWNHTISDKADFQLQAYYDHTLRDFGNGFTEDLKTYDLDWQHRNQIGQRHMLTYGIDLRLMDHKVTNLELFAFLPAREKLYRYNAFVQDEITLIDNYLRLTIGSKIGKNNYTGFEYQPNVRLSWQPAKWQTFWGAVSRAVRTPARIDRDFYLYLLPNLPLISGSDFRSETMIAYELGWRSRPVENLSVSLAAFYNVYDKLRSAEPGPPPLGIPITFSNGVEGNSWGTELSANWQVNNRWQLRGGYTFLEKDLRTKSTSKDMNGATAESDDPRHQVLIQSVVQIGKAIEWGTVLRYIDQLPKPAVSAYMGLDLRFGLKINKNFELDLVGQNLLHKQHLEFIPSSPDRREIKRSVFGKIICRL